MTNKTKPFSIRLTEAERADLERRADGQALSGCDRRSHCRPAQESEGTQHG